MPLTCERLIHGDRENRPVVDDAGKVTYATQKEFPYQCGFPAARYKVSGQSFTAFATLCKKHHKQAVEKDGFTLTPVQ